MRRGTFELTAEPVAARQCWCRLCQYLAVRSATTNIIVPRAALTLDGALTNYASVADSGNAMYRHFCPTCGTPIGGYAKVRGHLYVLRISTLDDPGRYPPQGTIWTAAAPAWALIDCSKPCLAGQPPAATPAPGTA